MITPRVMRIFFAIELAPSIKEKLAIYINGLKKKDRRNAIRWTKPENLHITLQFLAEVNSLHIDTLIDNVKASIQASLIKPSSLSLGKLHLFPTPYRPRVIVLDVTPQTDLSLLATSIGNGILASEYEIEKRPFRAHLTIGRIKYAQGVDLQFLSELNIPEFDDINVSEVVLFRSDPQPEGSKYTPINKIKLSA